MVRGVAVACVALVNLNTACFSDAVDERLAAVLGGGGRNGEDQVDMGLFDGTADLADASDSGGMLGPDGGSNAGGDGGEQDLDLGPPEMGPTFLALDEPADYVKACNSRPGAGFGVVALDGSRLVVGAPNATVDLAASVDCSDDRSFSGAPGAAYVYDFGGPTFARAVLIPETSSGDEGFGHAVAVSADRIAVGAPGANRVYVFLRAGDNWSLEEILSSNRSDAGDRFGASVALEEDLLIVGAPEEDGSNGAINPAENDDAPQAGAVFAFEFQSGRWQELAYIKASSAQSGDQFGAAVAVWQRYLLVGAPFANGGAASVNTCLGNEADEDGEASGAAYLFEPRQGIWAQSTYLKATNADPGDLFGSSVAIGEEWMVVGAPNEAGEPGMPMSNDRPGAGAVYAYRHGGDPGIRNCASQLAYVKASNAGRGDRFGVSVALSRRRVMVVGAPEEDSDELGLSDGPAENDRSPDNGAAYVFFDDQGRWLEGLYLKGQARDRDDGNGFSVAVSEVGVAIGAYGEDGATTGINGNSLDNSAPESGAVLLYRGR